MKFLVFLLNAQFDSVASFLRYPCNRRFTRGATVFFSEQGSGGGGGGVGSSSFDMGTWASILHPQTDRESRLAASGARSSPELDLRSTKELDAVADLAPPLLQGDEIRRWYTTNLTAMASIEVYWAELLPTLSHLDEAEVIFYILHYQEPAKLTI
jgi:hypothetical protein